MTAVVIGGLAGGLFGTLVVAAWRHSRRRVRPPSRSPRMTISRQDEVVTVPHAPVRTPPARDDRRSPRSEAVAAVGSMPRRPARTMRLIGGGFLATTSAGVAYSAGPGPAVLLLAAAVGVVLAVRGSRRRSAKRLHAVRASAAPPVIDLLGACLLAGLNPYRSLVRVAERGPEVLRAELARATVELDMGSTPAAALRAVGERTGLDELRAAAGALDAAERWGAPPAEALAARAEALRSRARLRAEAEAGRAAVRLAFPLVFCFLPAFVLLVVVPTMAGALRALAP